MMTPNNAVMIAHAPQGYRIEDLLVAQEVLGDLREVLATELDKRRLLLVGEDDDGR